MTQRIIVLCPKGHDAVETDRRKTAGVFKPATRLGGARKKFPVMNIACSACRFSVGAAEKTFDARRESSYGRAP